MSNEAPQGSVPKMQPQSQPQPQKPPMSPPPSQGPFPVPEEDFKTFELNLPSEGRIYDDNHPVRLSGGVVEVRQMTAKDEDILNNRQLLKQRSSVDTLLQRCIVSPKGLDVNSLVTGDKSLITVVIRINSLGDDYQVHLSCPKCGEVAKNESYSLSTVKIVRVNEENVAEEVGVNKFKFQLPMTKAEVVIRILTGHDEKDIDGFTDNIRKQQSANLSETEFRLMKMIISVNGKQDPGEIKKFINKMPAGDSKHIKKIYDKIAPDVEMIERDWLCPNPSCGEVSDVSVPVGTGFFWPELV